MKRAFVTALFLAILPLAAQESTESTAMHLTEQREVTSASTALLSASIDFRPDGTARTTHQVGNFSTRIEFKGLTVHEIVKLPVTEADAAKGVTRRYQAKLTCQAHRIWDGPMVAWSEWRENGYGFFPSTIVVEEVKGTLQASAKRIQDFSPGIDGAMTASSK
jgi:hypothetical protein